MLGIGGLVFESRQKPHSDRVDERRTPYRAAELARMGVMRLRCKLALIDVKLAAPLANKAHGDGIGHLMSSEKSKNRPRSSVRMGL